MAEWGLKYRESYDLQQVIVKALPIPFTMLNPSILIGIRTNQDNDFVGKLVQYLFIDGFGYVRANTMIIRSGYQCFDVTNSNQYRLEFEPDKSLGKFELLLWSSNMPVFNAPSSSSIANSAKTTSVASSIQSIELLKANPDRKGATIVNDSMANLFVCCNDVATVSNYIIKLSGGQYYELPFGYVGTVTGIWGAANGKAIITEFSS